jgi:hypothetical protein
MIRKLRASCDVCGEFELPAWKIRVLVVGKDSGGNKLLSQYRFRCPYCKKIWVRSATAGYCGLLIRAGAGSKELQIAQVLLADDLAFDLALYLAELIPKPK